MRAVGSSKQVTHAERIGYPLSFAQERLWFLDQLASGSSAFYNLPLAIRLSIPVNAHVLERALNECLNRHEILRTSFTVAGGEPRQVIEPSIRLNLPVIDLRHLQPAARQREAVRLATEEAARPFDLTRPPVLRAVLLRFGVRDHVLLLTIHHIAADDWSLTVLWRELAALYTAFAANRPSPLPRLRIQYLDYAMWQRKWLQGEVLGQQLAYWKRQLAGLRALALRTDYPRPPVATFRGAFENVAVPQPLAERVRMVAQREGCTLFITMLAVFQTLLARYTGQTDVAVGVPIANRSRAEVETLIGFFVNTLVMRTDLSGDPTFRELLRRTREMALAAYAHQDLPFEKLVEELQPQRDLNRNPLVQVTFQLQQRPEAGREAAGLGAEVVDVERGTAIFDFAFRLWDTSEGFAGGIEYSTDLFEAQTIRRIAGHYCNVLEAVTTNPDLRLSEISLMSAAERRQVLFDWNAMPAAYDHRACIHELVEAQARRTPERTAVVCEGASITYGEFDERANVLARRLQLLGVGPEVLVGVCMERSIEMVVALLAILKSGGAYLPLDPSYPQERLAYMVRDAGASVLLTQSHISNLLPAREATIIVVDRDMEAPISVRSAATRTGAAPDNLAYVVYTSGSTGVPKGAAISHAALVNHMLWMQTALPIGETDAVLQKTPISFDASVWEFWAPLISGARLVMASPERHIDGAFLVNQVLRHGITILQLVPSLLNLCLSEPRFHECRSLRRVFAGGEALSADAVLRFAATGLKAKLYNLYGPSETTIDSTWWECESEAARSSVPIGRPISGMEAYVLDANLEPVPPGIPGDLYVAGSGLGRGYLNAPDDTAVRFIPHPFSKVPGARLYRTGDLAAWRANGELEYIGRIDTQVKLHGIRIELGEIEAFLREHPQVGQAVAAVREDRPGDQRLVGYIVPRTGIPKSTELKRFLSGRLPEYMIPSTWVMLERLPVTPNGKVDRLALPRPEQNTEESAQGFVAASTPVEEKLVAIWKAVLNSRNVGAHDNFFELGGHSLLATQVVARVREEFRIDLPLRSLFQSPTPAELAAIVESAILEEIEGMPEIDPAHALEGGIAHA